MLRREWNGESNINTIYWTCEGRMKINRTALHPQADNKPFEHHTFAWWRPEMMTFAGSARAQCSGRNGMAYGYVKPSYIPRTSTEIIVLAPSGRKKVAEAKA